MSLQSMERGQQICRTRSSGAISGPMFAILLTIAAVVAAFYFGPVTAKRQWDAVKPRAESDITDVVQRGLESYLSHNGVDLTKAHFLPQVRQVDFRVTPIMFSLPAKVGFHGTTTQGEFKGLYYTHSGEVEAQCEVGGVTFAGLSNAYRHGNTTFKVTGHKKNGQLAVKVNGQNADVVYPQHTP